MRRSLLLLAVVPLGCRPTGSTTSPEQKGETASAGGAGFESGAAPPAIEAEPPEPEPIDLGPADAPIRPLTDVTPPKYELKWRGRNVLFGRASSGTRPKDAGMGGKLLVAIDTPYQLFARGHSYVHVAAWRTNGKPASGARVFLGNREVGRTDHTGTLVFKRKGTKVDEDDYDAWDRDSVISVVDDGNRCGAASFTPYSRTPTFASDHLFVYADRGVFRPGDTIHLRTIAWRLTEDYQPLAKAPVELWLSDEEGHQIAAGTRATTELGTASLDLSIPTTAREGLYTLTAAYGTERATSRLQIRNFEAPTIDIEHTLGRFITLDQKTLPFEVRLKDAAGGTIDKAHVTVSALAGETTVVSVERDVEGVGPHGFELSRLQLRKLRKQVPQGSFATLKIEVRDGLGRTEELQREMRVTANPWVAVLEADKDQYGTGDKVVVVARITDLDRVPLRGENVKLRLQGGATLETKTDKGGMASFDLKMPGSATTAELLIPDVATPVAVTTLPWVPPRAMLSELPDPIVKERKTAKVVVRFPNDYRPADGHVHVDVTDTSGAIVGATLLKVREEKGGFVARGEFDAPSWGSMLLTMFALGKQKGQKHHGPGEVALLTEGQNLVVQPDRELEVTLKAVPKEVKPGAALDVQAVVRTAEGKPAKAEVGVALVDASVVGLKDPLEITPMDDLYNPELRTMSTTGSKILTWPVVTRNWGDARFDIALPPFAALEGGDVDGCRGTAARSGSIGYGMGMGSGGAAGGVAAKAKTSSTGSSAKAPNMDPPPPPKPMKKMAKEIPMEANEAAEAGEGVCGAEASSSGTDRRGPAAAHARAVPATITIRTEFPDTAIWRPHVDAREGKAPITGAVPDRIGAQELIVVASDGDGGVGIARETIAVRQPVHVHAELPVALVAGEQLEIPALVTNSTPSAASFEVALGKQSRTVQVDAGKRGVVALPLKASRAGSMKLDVRAVGAGHDDRMLRSIRVDPAGLAVPTVQTATLSASKATTLEIDAPKDGAVAHLEVQFPAITSAFPGLDTLPQVVSDNPSALAVDLTTAALLVRYADEHGIWTRESRQMKEHLLGVLGMLRMVQRSDGAFAWWRNGEASPYVTAWALEGLIEAREAGLPAPDDVITRAATWVSTQIGPDKLVDAKDIGWWEGDTKAVREGLTAEIFDVLTRVPKPLSNSTIRIARTNLALHYEKVLGERDVDSLTAAHALSGLLRMGKIDGKTAVAHAKHLVATRNAEHWEPSWFHAYAGRIDATALVLDVLQRAAPQGFAAEKRDALQWILATQEGWGQWHAERGTAAAIRALLSVGAAPREVASTVTVELDGKVIETVKVDPKDPLKSTMALAHLDLGDRLDAGKHEVTIRYDGALEPSARLVTRTWMTGTADATKAHGTRLEAKLSEEVAADARTWLKIKAGGNLRGATIHVAPTGLLEVDTVALARRTGPTRDIESFAIDEHGLELVVSPRTESASIAVPMRAVRRGTGRAPAVGLVRASADGKGGAPLIVDAGPLTVR